MTALVIANTQIRQDSAGRYCLNDLHHASGGAKRHQPGNWLRLDQTKDLLAELVQSEEGVLSSEEAPLHTVNTGFANGTYAVKELVYAYAMWISAAFHLHVIRAYDAMVTARQAEQAAPVLMALPQHRADQLVSAGRIFGAALRTARSLRLPPGRAMQAAFDCALRHTGIDWSSELGMQPEDTLQLAAPEAAGDVGQFHEDWRTGLLGVPYAPALSVDVYALYSSWCQERDALSLPMNRFTARLCVRGGPVHARKRWCTPEGATGQNSFVIPLGHIHTPASDSEREWLGRCVQAFRTAFDPGDQPDP